LAQGEIDRLDDELRLATAPPKAASVSGELGPDKYVDALSGIVRDHLGKAADALAPVRPLRALRDWYSGAAVEQAWINIHRAGEALLMIQSPGSVPAEFVQIDAAFRATVQGNDPRAVNLAWALAEIHKVLFIDQRPELMTGVLRSKLKAVRSVVDVASDTAHETVRRWRNLLVIGGTILAAFAVAVTVAHALAPEFFSLVPAAPTAQVGDAIEPWQVALVGSLGGSLAAVLALNRFSGYTDPAGLPVVQALLRVPTAAVTALVGVLLMQSSTFDALKPQNGLAVLAYAFFFGYAQEPLLRAIDRRAGAVLDPARSKDEPAKTIPPAPPRLPPLPTPPDAPPPSTPPQGDMPLGPAKEQPRGQPSAPNQTLDTEPVREAETQPATPDGQPDTEEA
jgi:hypothetical protein